MDSALDIDDLLKKILGLVNDGLTYQTVRLVSRKWLAFVGDRVDEFSNHLWTLIKKYPNASWDWGYVAKNPNTTWNHIKDNKNLLELSSEISLNPNITWNIVVAHPEVEWNYSCLLTRNYNLFCLEKGNIVTIFKKHCDTSGSNYGFLINYLVRNPAVRLDDIIANIQNWKDYMSTISQNPSITWEEICYTLVLGENTGKKIDWNWKYLTINPNITMEIILSNKDKPWDLGRTPENPNFNITMLQYLLANDIKVDMNTISEHPNITWEFIQANPQINWNYMWVASNPNVTWDIIKKNKELFTSRDISNNPNLTWRIINSNTNLGWVWRIVSFNKFTKYRYMPFR